MPYVDHEALVILQQQNGLMDSTLHIAKDVTVQTAWKIRQDVEDTTQHN